MLLCGISDLEPGLVVAAPILHPLRPDLELLSAGAVLDAAIIRRLGDLGVTQAWVRHDATADLDRLLEPKLRQARQEVYQQLKADFSHMSGRTLTHARLQAYRQAVMDLVCQVISNRKIAGLADQLHSTQQPLFTHCANVAYLALLIGLDLQNYIIQQRPHLKTTYARDLTSLGLGGMLHDLGKATLSPQAARHHEVFPNFGACDPEEYELHPMVGYQMLRCARVPASARQAVLCHHQRFDGSGWPGLSLLGGSGNRGRPSARGIHIFSRIVAAANVLDNLLSDADGQRRPPVAALHDFAGERYRGWFDPLIRDSMLRRLPPFPLGCMVRLNDGRAASVIAPGHLQPCRPVVRLLQTGSGATSIDLSERPDLHIVQCAGVDVRHWLFELAAPTPIAASLSSRRRAS